MAKPPRDRSNAPGRTYFVTASTWERRMLFQSRLLADLFIETLFCYRANHKYELHEFVLMPNHFHILLTPARDITLERAMQLIKGGSSHRAGQVVGRKMEIWQRGYVDHRIRNAADYLHHREYI